MNLSLNHEKFNFSTGAIINEKLAGKNSDRYQFVLPYYDFSKSLPFQDNLGTLNLNSSGMEFSVEMIARATLENLKITLQNIILKVYQDNYNYKQVEH